MLQTVQQRGVRIAFWLLLAVDALVIAGIVADRWPPRCLNSTLFTLSFELHDAPCARTASQRVAAWLFERRFLIYRAASKYNVSHNAIAGAVAYEALDDVHLFSVFGLTRSDGPGKVHYKAQYIAEGWPIAREIEQLDYVRGRNLYQRKAYLQSDTGSITYIAAILRALSDVARRGNVHISCSPDVLLALYTQFDLHSASEIFQTGTAGLEFLRRQRAAEWMRRHALFISRSLGRSEVAHC